MQTFSAQPMGIYSNHQDSKQSLSLNILRGPQWEVKEIQLASGQYNE